MKPVKKTAKPSSATSDDAMNIKALTAEVEYYQKNYWRELDTVRELRKKLWVATTMISAVTAVKKSDDEVPF